MLASKDFVAAKEFYFQWARPDDHSIKSLMIIHLIVREF